MSDSEQSPAVKTRAFLDAPLRVGLTDGRVMVGTFACFDKQRNVLLVDAREWRWTASLNSDATEKVERHLGIVLVPWRWITSCHALQVESVQ